MVNDGSDVGTAASAVTDLANSLNSTDQPVKGKKADHVPRPEAARCVSKRCCSVALLPPPPSQDKSGQLTLPSMRDQVDGNNTKTMTP